MNQGEKQMKTLTEKERELVAIGAALGSNCVPCVVYHIRQARKKGITDDQIRESIAVAEEVRKMPAELVRNTAFAQLEDADGKSDVPSNGSSDDPCGCASAAEPNTPSCCD